jgi:hypothetical protein
LQLAQLLYPEACARTVLVAIVIREPTPGAQQLRPAVHRAISQACDLVQTLLCA